jgi:hypothetical protein
MPRRSSISERTITRLCSLAPIARTSSRCSRRARKHHPAEHLAIREIAQGCLQLVQLLQVGRRGARLADQSPPQIADIGHGKRAEIRAACAKARQNGCARRVLGQRHEPVERVAHLGVRKRLPDHQEQIEVPAVSEIDPAAVEIEVMLGEHAGDPDPGIGNLGVIQVFLVECEHDRLLQEGPVAKYLFQILRGRGRQSVFEHELVRGGRPGGPRRTRRCE